MTEVQRWADAAMFRSDPMPEENRAPGGGVRPTVTLLNATPDPLGSLAALYGIYTGKVFRSLSEVTDTDRREAWNDMDKTVLNGPLEAVTFHFLVEGVTRSFTHQAVRSRFSFFAQETLRFAVPDGQPWRDRVAYPPSLAAEPAVGDIVRDAEAWVNESPEEETYRHKREVWDRAVTEAQVAYQRLIDAGIPAEDARGLMPHAIATRYHWIVDLRTLLTEAGKRLCTQAQFEWRAVFAGVAQAIRGWGERRNPSPEEVRQAADSEEGDWTQGKFYFPESKDHWQFELIADALRPVCYQTGNCGFMAKFDRGCTIRPRVEAFAHAGIPSNGWGSSGWVDATAPGRPSLLPIQPAEWLTDPNAARVAPGAKGGAQ